MEILVTGATGFIGRHLQRRLTDGGHTVVGTTTAAHQRPGLVRLDLADVSTLTRLPQRAGAVVHLAALRSRSFSDEQSAEQALLVNGMGTLHLLRYALRSGARHFVYISSNTVYEATGEPLLEEAATVPSTAYGIGKLAGELYCRWVAQQHPELAITILRLSSVFGPDQEPTSMLPIFLDRARTGQAITVYGEGRGRWDFVHVEDVCDAVAAALEQPTGGLFNIGSGELVSVAWIVERIAELTGTQVEFLRDREESCENRVMDIGNARKHLGYAPKRPLAEFLAAALVT